MYSQLIQKLFNITLINGIKSGLENALLLQKLLDYPDRSFKTIHVAGTNGKGSVSTKIAKGLEAAGYQVGLYTSPHISSFQERIQINGKFISEYDVVQILSSLFHLIEEKKFQLLFLKLQLS